MIHRIVALVAASFPAAKFGPLLALDDPIVLNDDGGWCWFQDPRALIVGDKLVFGSVASGYLEEERRGDIEVTSYDMKTGETQTFELHDRLQLDDHDAPALLERPDGRLIAVYAKHGNDDLVRVRISSRPRDASAWQPERSFPVGDGVTYSNVYLLSDAREGKGRVFDFHRGKGWDPNFLISDDLGVTWSYGGRVLGGPGRPYLRYACDGKSDVHLIATEQHPRQFDNSVYHAVLRGGVLHTSDGKALARIDEREVAPEELTRVFAGDADHVAWTVDLELDRSGDPVALLSVQRDGAGQPSRQGGLDHRFYYARWDGERWNVHQMCYAGTRLYAGEDDYTGLGAIDPDDTGLVLISTDAHPVSGKPLISTADGKRHREIFVGRTQDGGETFAWDPVTSNSSEDNLRPIVPRWNAERTFVLWLRGEYRSYTDYDLEVVGREL